MAHKTYRSKTKYVTPREDKVSHTKLATAKRGKRKELRELFESLRCFERQKDIQHDRNTSDKLTDLNQEG